MAREMAIRGTHDRVMQVLAEVVDLHKPLRVLDIGAGQGAFSARLKEAGLSVSACDADPGPFDVPGLDCTPCDGSGALPFDDGAFDLAVAVEVVEHIEGHDRFFAEVARVLVPGGTFVFTTPNILSLKSRLRFLFTGRHYSFGPLVPFTKNPVRQHISPFTLNRYEWALSQHELAVDRVTTDKFQHTSLLCAFLVPFIWLATRLQRGADPPVRPQNSAAVLFGRKLVIVARKTNA